MKHNLNQFLFEPDGGNGGVVQMTEEQLAEFAEKAAKKALEKAGVKNESAVVPPVVDANVKKELGDIKGLGDFAQAVKKRDSEKLKAFTTDAAGEYIIPAEYASEIMKVGVQQANFWNRGRNIPLKNNSVKIPYMIDKNHTDGNVFGGITMSWVDEEGTIPSKPSPKFGKVELNLHKLAGIIPASNEFIEDAPFGVDVMVRDLFGQVLGWTLDGVTLDGNGSGKPLGIFNSPALIEVAKESGQAADTINLTNILKMYSRLHPASKRNAVWVYTQDMLPQLMSLTLGQVPIFMAGNSLTNQPYETILGRPAISSEFASALGDKGDIALIDFSQYLTATKQGAGVKFDQSMHLYFDTDRQAFRITFRCDGQPWWETYVTPKKGLTQSPFITLAERA